MAQQKQDKIADHEFAAKVRETLGVDNNQDALAAIQQRQDAQTTSSTQPGQNPQQPATGASGQRGGPNDPTQAQSMGAATDADVKSLEAQQAEEKDSQR